MFGVVIAYCLMVIIVVNSGWANYFWDRWNYGGVIKIADQCYDLPFGWTFAPNRRESVEDIRRHFVSGGVDTFATVQSSKSFVNLKNMDLERFIIGDDFIVYDLGTESPLRYIALNEVKEIGIVASKEELLQELVMGLSVCK
ncbi:hypothetical protein [Cellvibrio japonicus]|uniref:Uncharacterized protein n=1 Tax=Cellvibrio japonicus (strain Ueda107) TaxID=498211 RepID=B3PED9_CELJU|nr:hypothetical protein [Cellvibrio japonicus]ACE83318.1 hypothetical protein CJA_3241 [Cellvibrio japonicus Ueda107]QEI13513.1 hypothetical protein FY117_15660 [Cellvibrio japonicus]QEI17087.1 hypothetical protein FY116_15665 [Cellvibrio japonicus]QEI20665.1 hypothetical protein FY115_15660 [Cellvibrio japonicus]